MDKLVGLSLILVSSCLKAADWAPESLSDIDHVEYAMRDVSAEPVATFEPVEVPSIIPVQGQLRQDCWDVLLWSANCPYPRCKFSGKLLEVAEHLDGPAHTDQMAEGLLYRFTADPVSDFEIYLWDRFSNQEVKK